MTVIKNGFNSPQLLGVLQELIMETEHVYSYIHSKLPTIEREMDITVQEMTTMLHFFLPSGEINDTQSPKLTDLLNEINSSFAKTGDDLINETFVKNMLESFLDDNKSSYVGLKQLYKMINEVNKSLKTMGVLSLNAQIYASKLGLQGKSFSVVGEKITKISDELMSSYANLAKDVTALEGWQENFKGSISEIINYHNQISSTQRQDINKLFQTVFSSLEGISIILGNLISNVQVAINPIQEIMIGIQAQDIIRQNIENLGKIIGHLKEYFAEEEVEQEGLLLLNTYNTLEKVIALTLKLAENINENLITSLKGLKPSLRDIRSQLIDTQNDGVVIIDFLGGTGVEGRNSVVAIFSDIFQFYYGFIENLKDLQLKLNGLTGVNYHFNQKMYDISHGLKGIKNKVEFLQKLKILANIELVRLNQDSSSFMIEIEKFSQRIKEDIDNYTRLVKSLEIKLKAELENFFKLITITNQKTQLLIAGLDETFEKITFLEKMISEGIQALGVSGYKLIQEVDVIAENIEVLENNVLNKSTILFEMLNELQKNVIKEKEILGQKLGVVNWEGSCPQLESILEKFTTCLERTEAKKIFDLEFDTGSEGGELTLF